MLELLSPEDHRIIPAFNDAVNEQMALHIGGDAKGADFDKLTDTEFVELVRASERQPLKPLATMREALGYDEDATVEDVLDGLRSEHSALNRLYLSNGIDPTGALRTTADIIDLTESYIAGYSRMIGVFAASIEMSFPGANGLRRWNDHIWVPEEDGHDRTLALDRLARDDGTDKFDSDHIKLMQIGAHPKLDSIPTAISYPDLQESATDPSYKNRAALLGPVLGKPSKEIGSQEIFHFRTYSNILQAVFDADPDRTAIAYKKEVDDFAMPGREGIDDYERREKEAAMTGLLDPVSVIEVKRKTIKRLGIKDRVFKSDAAKQAQYELIDPDGKYGITELEKRRRQLDKVRERVVTTARKAGQLMPAILGVTVDAHPVTGELSFPMSK